MAEKTKFEKTIEARRRVTGTLPKAVKFPVAKKKGKK